MSRIKIEFEETAGYPQRDTIRMWQDGEEITDGLKKGTLLVVFARKIVSTI